MGNNIIPRNNCIWEETIHVSRRATSYYVKGIIIILTVRSAMEHCITGEETHSKLTSQWTTRGLQCNSFSGEKQFTINVNVYIVININMQAI